MNAIVPAAPRLPMINDSGVSPGEWKVLVEAVWPGARSPDAVKLALDYCRARKLDPFKRPVHIVPMWNSSLRREVETVWPGISELQTTAARTGQWAGMDEPKFGPIVRKKFSGNVGRQGQERAVTVEVSYPEWCSVTVYRMVGGQRCGFSEPVWWEEAYARQGRSAVPNEMWAKRPRGQLMKVAKAASLRAAFPEENGNDYAAEEMEGREIEAGGVTIEHEPEPETAAAAQSLAEAPPESTPRKGRKIGDIVDAVRAAVVRATTVREVLAIGEGADVAALMKHANAAVQAEVKALLAEAYAEAERREAAEDDAAEAEAETIEGEVVPPYDEPLAGEDLAGA